MFIVPRICSEQGWKGATAVWARSMTFFSMIDRGRCGIWS